MCPAMHSTMRTCRSIAGSRASYRVQVRRKSRHVAFAADPGEPPVKPTLEQTQASKEAFGELTDAEIPEGPDFWEGENWEWVENSAKFVVPALVVLAVAIGGFAANTYNGGAECAPFSSFLALLCPRTLLSSLHFGTQWQGARGDSRSACSSYLVNPTDSRPAQIISKDLVPQ